ncbi:MAG: alpha/beta fold hydrolase [Flavobacteriaceae bacterium]
MKEHIKSDFPFESRYVKVYGSKMHYIDENVREGSDRTTFILLHGNPSSNYLWRNIISELAKEGRVIAPDLIGFGKSDRPQIDYKVFTHAKYIEEFINILKLDNIIFALHNLGAAIVLHYAGRYESKIKGLLLWNFI